MKAMKSELAKRVLRAGINIQPEVPFEFEGKTYTPVIVSTDDGKPLKPISGMDVDRVQRLMDACEGEVGGLALSRAAARRILAFVDGGTSALIAEAAKLGEEANSGVAAPAPALPLQRLLDAAKYLRAEIAGDIPRAAMKEVAEELEDIAAGVPVVDGPSNKGGA